MLSDDEYNQINNRLDNLSSNYLSNTVSITISDQPPEYGWSPSYDITINENSYKVSYRYNSFISGSYDQQLDQYEVHTSTIYAQYPLHISAESIGTETDRLTLKDKEGNIIYRDFGGTYQFTIPNGPKQLYIENICND